MYVLSIWYNPTWRVEGIIKWEVGDLGTSLRNIWFFLEYKQDRVYGM